MAEDKNAQAVKQAQQAAAAKGGEQEQAQQEARKLRQEAEQKASEAGGVAAGDYLPADSPYQDYDFMPLADLVALADERGVTIQPDVLKAHLISELRAHQSGNVSAAARYGAR